MYLSNKFLTKKKQIKLTDVDSEVHIPYTRQIEETFCVVRIWRELFDVISQLTASRMKLGFYTQLIRLTSESSPTWCVNGVVSLAPLGWCEG